MRFIAKTIGSNIKITSLVSLSLLSLWVSVFSCTPNFVATKITRTQTGTKNLSERQFGLVNGNRRLFSLDELEKAVTPLFERETEQKKNIIFHVHGAGYYPKTAFILNEFRIIREKYNAEVIMFFWPAFIDIRSIPRANAHAAGLYLQRFLKNVEAFRNKNPDAYDKRNITLTLHSMGAEVFKSAVENQPQVFENKLFDSIVLIAPEVQLRNHAKWLEQVDFAYRVVVVMNSDDRTLNIVKLHTNEARLGMQIQHLDGSAERLASNVTYIIADDAVNRHKYYLYDHNQPFRDFLTGVFYDDEDVLSGPNLQMVKSNVFRVKK